MALFQRELSDKEKEKRREEFQTYLQKVLDCDLARENSYLAFKFLQLPISVYTKWYLYQETDSEIKDLLIKFQTQQFKELRLVTDYFKSKYQNLRGSTASSNTRRSTNTQSEKSQSIDSNFISFQEKLQRQITDFDEDTGDYDSPERKRRQTQAKGNFHRTFTAGAMREMIAEADEEYERDSDSEDLFEEQKYGQLAGGYQKAR